MVEKRKPDLEKLKHWLADKGLKATHQRLVILEELYKNFDHPNAEDLFMRLRENNPALSIATIYKTLETFHQKGLVEKIHTGEDSVRFDANPEEHNHIYCSKTQKLIDYKDEELEQMLADYFKKKRIENFAIKDIQIQINGNILDLRKHVKID